MKELSGIYMSSLPFNLRDSCYVHVIKEALISSCRISGLSMMDVVDLRLTWNKAITSMALSKSLYLISISPKLECPVSFSWFAASRVP
jgi:hypothetical protein